jgi:hypothetical protein
MGLFEPLNFKGRRGEREKGIKEERSVIANPAFAG